MSVEQYKPVFDPDDDCWRVAVRGGKQGRHSVWDTLGWMRFATREAAEQWIERETGLHLDRREQSERVCACGCGASLDGMRKDAIYASPQCRSLGWKRRVGYADPRRRKASRNGKTRRSGPSGLQVSYRKAVETAIEMLVAGCDEMYIPEEFAERFMSRALSERQRALLEQREAA